MWMSRGVFLALEGEGNGVVRWAWYVHPALSLISVRPACRHLDPVYGMKADS